MSMTIQADFSTSLLAAPDTIVVATDLTDMAELLPHAIAQAKTAHAVLKIVHAIAPEMTYDPESGMIPGPDPLKASRDARLRMLEISHQVEQQGVSCSTAVRHGFAADVIAEVVHETDAGRVLARTHGRRGIKRLALGSVTLQLLQHLDVPVCTIGPRCAGVSNAGLHRILHPTGLGPDCDATAHLALDLAQDSRAELTMLYVLREETAVEPYLDPDYSFERLESLLPALRGDLWSPVRTRIAAGNLEEEILRCAKDTSADLIVMGVHPAQSFWPGHSGGKTAYAIMAAATCPVLSFRVPAGYSMMTSQPEQHACVLG